MRAMADEMGCTGDMNSSRASKRRRAEVGRRRSTGTRIRPLRQKRTRNRKVPFFGIKAREAKHSLRPGDISMTGNRAQTLPRC